MFEGIQNVPRIPELRRRLGYTLGMLAVYRIGVAILPTSQGAPHVRFEKTTIEGQADIVHKPTQSL